MSKLFKLALLFTCLAVTAAVMAVPALREAATAATYTAPPRQPERAADLAGRPIANPSQLAAGRADDSRARSAGSAGVTDAGSAGWPTAPIYQENIVPGGAGRLGAAGTSLADHAYFLLDPAGRLGIEQAGSPARQSSYTRLRSGVPITSTGVFWLRFSLASANPDSLQPAASPILRLAPGTPPAKMYVAQEFAQNGDVRRWREIAPASGGAFSLPDPHGLPLTVYMKFDGVPGLWFNPQLTAAGAEPADPARYLLLAAQIVLGLSILALLLRGLAGRQEWRLWGAAVMGCALVQALFCRQSPELGSVYLTALPPLLAPGLLVMLTPHLGRHLLQSHERRLMDFLLIAMSLPGAAAALLPLAPGLGWSAKFLPLAPLLLLPPFFVAAAALSRRRPGSATYFLICLLPLLGALLALLGLVLAEMRLDFDNSLYRLGPSLASYGCAAAALVMMFSGRARGETKEDFFPLEISPVSSFNADDEQDLKLYAASELSDLPELRLIPAPGLRLKEAKAPLPEPLLSPPTPAPPSTPPLDEDEEPVLRVVRLYTPEPLKQASEQEEPETASDALGDTAAVEETAEENAPCPPSRLIEDATGATAPFNLAEADRYKDKEEPGLVIIKPRPSADLAEPPFPLDYQRGPDEQEAAEQDGRIDAPTPDPDEPLELTELAWPAEASESPAPVTEPPLPAEQAAGSGTPASFPAGLAETSPEQEAAPRQDASGPAAAPGDALSGLDEALNCLDRLARAEAMNKADLRVFNLSSLVRRIHADTVSLAEKQGIALSWFVSPSLDLLYKGDEKTLRLTLSHMLRGAVESARDGAIQLAVRPAPEGENLLRFSLTDSALTPDSPRPPARLLSRAWELACASQGSFSIEFVPERGTSINFSLRLKPLEDEDYIEAARSGLRPESRRKAAAAGTAPARPPLQPLGLAEMTGLADPASNAKDLDGPLDAAILDEVSLSIPSTRPVRDSIVIVDPADSGRRLIARRLGGLPYEKIEAASLRDAVQACSWGNVALLILDGEIAAEEVRQALADIASEETAAGRPPAPSLCLLSHMSQCERLLKAGCTACQIKSENREEFQALVQKLIAAEPECSANLNAEANRPQAGLLPRGNSASMLEMIVSSLDSESAELENSGRAAPEPQGQPADRPAGLTGPGGEYIDPAMLPMIPDFLELMREHLLALEEGVAGMKFTQVQEATAGMQAQCRIYGLNNLERMAACVERAAQAKDREAVSDLAEELALMCRRYLSSLQETYESAAK